MKKLILFFLFSAVIFLPLTAGGSGLVVINEIAWMGTPAGPNFEWIELKNLGMEAVDLGDWILAAADGTPTINLSGNILPGAYFLLERSDDNSVPGIPADLIFSGALGNTGEDLVLFDNNGAIVDRIDASGGWPAGDNTSKQTMVRDEESGEWKNSLEPGGTPRASNTVEVLETVEDEEENGIPDADEENQNPDPDETVLAEETLFNYGSVLINEFVSDPADGGEWVEIYNKSGEVINLDDWRLEEGSGGKTYLSGTIGIGGFYVIENPKGYLNNNGDVIILMQKDKVIDRVAYGNWAGGTENAPAAKKPYGSARRLDGYNTSRPDIDFLLTSTLTPGKTNVITDPFLTEEESLGMYSENIFITEIFPDPFGSDYEDEFIEIYNNDNSSVDLNGWILKDESIKTYKLKTVIPAKSYLAVYRPESGLALNNSGDSVFLFPPASEDYLRKVEYKKATEGQSYNLIDINIDKWVWSETISPGEKNIFVLVNESPLVDFSWPAEVDVGRPILFDSSDTVDPENEALSFFWDFGDGFTNILPSPEHTYFKEGVYLVKLTVSDGKNIVDKEKSLTLKSKTGIIATGTDMTARPEIRINEIMPDPVGSDEAEWMELYNAGEYAVNIGGWHIDDEEGGSKPYALPDFLMDTGVFLVIHRSQSRIALNNDGDSARLFDPEMNLVYKIDYEKTFEGKSFAYGEDEEWHWTSSPTPGSHNIISTGFEEYGDFPVYESARQKEPAERFVSLSEIRSLEAGEKIKVLGRVAVLPGVLASQYFYIVDSGSAQIYSNKKDFPDLKLGDIVEVSGEISIVNSETRVKTKTQSDIKIIEHQAPPKAIELDCDQVDEESAGELVRIAGIITERKGQNLYVDDGTDEARVYIKTTTGIIAKEYKKGGEAAVTGIINMTGSGARLMPRSPEDIEIIYTEDAAVEMGEVLGESASSAPETEEWILPKRDGREELYEYILVVASGLIVLLGWWIIKIKFID